VRPPAPGSPAAVRRGARARRLLSLFLLFHGAATAASFGKDTALGRQVRTLTAPYERALGLWQSWGMFGPNPPLGTSWLHVAGLRADGSRVPLDALVGPRGPDRVDLRYDRVLKLERNMFDTRNDALRAGFATWHCARAAAAGAPLLRVDVRKERWPSRSPRQRARGEAPAPPKSHALGSYWCP
jgi:hypothetical protein